MSTVKLGEVAIESRESLKEKDKSLPVVGLEHIIPEQINLTEWDIGVENTFTKTFEKGDILFGRRRAYLKKAAVAPCKGICSGDITVIRAKEDKILPELLPFVIQNDIFFDYAVGKSAGSLSPRVKWEHLANYEFNLPPLEEQKKLAQTLWKIVATMESYKKLLEKTDELVKVKFVEMFGSIDNSKWMYKRLGELCKISSGYAFKSDRFQNKGVPVLRIGNINSGVLKKNNLVFWPDDTSLSKYILYPGDLAMSLTGTVGKDDYGNICILNDEYPKYYLNQRNAKFSDFNDNLNKLYLAYYFKLPLVKKTLTNSNHGVRQANILNKDLENILLPLPPITLQNEYVNFVRKSEESKVAIQTSLNSLKQVYKKIITENLGGSN